MSTLFERVQLEQKEKWREVTPLIPPVKVPEGCKIIVIPPFNGAAARFRIKKGKNISVSVYLDTVENLGFYGGPYWEVYPVGGDVYRCGVEEKAKPDRAIARSIREQEKAGRK